MKCINKLKKIIGIVCTVTAVCVLIPGCGADKAAPGYASDYEKTAYNQDLYRGTFFANNLCVTAQDVSLESYPGDATAHAAGLFDLNQQKVLYADRIYEKLYPASTTKVLTAYIALKYGNPDDIVTVSENATNFEADASLCGLQPGDQLSLYDLICGLTLASGNDAGTAIAEHISGSVEAFAQRMNEEALALGATGSHFVNPHGLHDENHYTTAYDLYLFFNAAVANQQYLEILAMKSYTGTITGADGTVRNPEWMATNYYSAGVAEMPEGIRVLGGKTGTTDEAGNCVILYDEDGQGNPYISIIMGASDKTVLYENMSRLLNAGISKS